jgi:hypothetical protein
MCSPAERSWFNRLLQLDYIDAFAHYFSDTKRPYTWWNTENNFINRRGLRVDFFNTKHLSTLYATAYSFIGLTHSTVWFQSERSCTNIHDLIFLSNQPISRGGGRRARYAYDNASSSVILDASQAVMSVSEQDDGY